ncbi:MAG: hypothetical protein GC157_10310 [Frankiales bacterium]|nr:hypothetical protein [Frankiales bacterium]
MSAAVRGRAAWTWWAAVAVTAVSTLVALPAAFDLRGASLMIPTVACLAVGAVVARRRPENPVGWIFLAVATLSSLDAATRSLLQLALRQQSDALALDPTGGSVVWPWWVVPLALFWSTAWFVMLYLMPFLICLMFPSGLPSRRWRPLLAAGTTVLVVVVSALTLKPTIDISDGTRAVPVLLANPISPAWTSTVDPTSGAMGVLLPLAVVACLVGAVAAPFVRVRRASVVERAQLRWFGFSAALFVLVMLLVSFVPVLVPGGPDGTAANAAFAVSTAFIPLGCGIAILRYRLFDIDRIISRTASYSIVTALALAVYAVVVASASNLLPEGSSSLAVAAATLAAAAMVRPALRRVQRWVDRRFNREKVDAQAAVDAFGASLVDDVDPEHGRAQLEAVARRLLAPSTVAVGMVRR